MEYHIVPDSFNNGSFSNLVPDRVSFVSRLQWILIKLQFVKES